MPDHIDPAAWKRAGKLLRSLLPAARTAAKKETDSKFEATSSLGAAMQPHVRENALDALFIYQNSSGGWIADVVLKDIPPGISNTFGTPASRGHRTQKEAEAEGFSILVMMLQMAAENAALEQAAQAPRALPPQFLLFGAEIELIPDLVAQFHTDPKVRLGSQSTVHNFVKHILSETVGDEADFTKAAFDALSRDDQLRILTAVHMAAAGGVHRYPPVTELTPSGHQIDPEDSQKLH